MGLEGHYQGDSLKGIKDFVRIAGIQDLEAYFKSVKKRR